MMKKKLWTRSGNWMHERILRVLKRQRMKNQNWRRRKSQRITRLKRLKNAKMRMHRPDCMSASRAPKGLGRILRSVIPDLSLFLLVNGWELLLCAPP
jgi:hypothetical protein